MTGILTFLTIPKETAIVWLKMIIRACVVIIISAAALRLNETAIAITYIIQQLAQERLNLFSEQVTGTAKAAPSWEQQGREAALWEALRLQSQPATPPTVPAPPREG